MANKILIHGATNWGSSNFGDFIYADAAVRRVRMLDSEAEIRLAEPSDYFLKYLPDCSQSSFKDGDANLVIYIPGGYFGEGHGYRLRDEAVHFVRFFPVGIKSSYRKQNICVVGVGAGPISNCAMRWGIKRICNHAISLTVRDVESMEALESIGVNNAKIAFDPIVSLPINDWAISSPQLDAFELDDSKKTLLVHYNHSKDAAAVFAEALNRYVRNLPEPMNIVISSDQLLATEKELFDYFCSLIEFPVFKFTYDNPYEFITLLKACDYILTCKLHVGVIGMMLGASVICVAEHPEKTMRFYSHVGCPERCASLYSADSDAVFNLIRSHLDSPMPAIQKEDIDLAESSWRTIDDCLGM